MTYPRFETETYGNSEMAAHHPWSQKSLVTPHQAEWSNMSLLIPESIGYYIKGDK